MTWHLKDKELEKQLIKLNPNFLEIFQREVNFSKGFRPYIEVIFNRETPKGFLENNRLLFLFDDLEETPDYNPKTWNEFPKITPPKNVWMRVEAEDGYGIKAKWDGDCWKDGNNCYFTYTTFRYRPWEDW